MQDTWQTFRCTYIPVKLQLGTYTSKCSSLEGNLNLKPGTEFSFKFHAIMRQKIKESTMLFSISVNLRWIVGAIYFGDNLLWLLHSHKGKTRLPCHAHHHHNCSGRELQISGLCKAAQLPWTLPPATSTPTPMSGAYTGLQLEDGPSYCH